MGSLSPSKEKDRLAALRAYAILDTPPEPGFEHITGVVVRLFAVPMAAVVLIDAERQWFKSIRGFDARETPREWSFCTHALTSREVLTVPDAHHDPRFADNPFVTGEPFVRFYAGAPLHSPEGHALGALCIADRQPREITAAEEQTLAAMASLVEDELLLRRVAEELRRKTSAHEAAQTTGVHGDVHPGAAREGRFRRIVEQASDAIFVYDLHGRLVDVNAAACAMVGYEREELLRLLVRDIEVSFDPLKTPQRWRELAPGEAVSLEGFNRRKGGGLFPAEARVSVVENVGVGGERLLLALVRDVSGRKYAEKLLQARACQQQTIARLGTAALGATQMDVLMAETVEAIGTTLGVEICRIFEHLPARGELVVRAALPDPEPAPETTVLPDDPDSATGYALRQGEPVIVHDARTDRRFAAAPWLAARGAVSGLNVTIGGDGTHLPVYGVVVAYNRWRREFTADDVFFVQSAANVLAAAIVRQQAVDASRQSEERFRRANVHAPFPIMLHTGDGEVLMVNDAWTHLTGYPAEQLPTLEAWLKLAYHTEAERDGVREFLARVWEYVGAVENPGQRIRCADGGTRVWDFSGVNLGRLPDGRWLRLATAVDVTERHQQVAALRSAKEEAERANAAKSVFLSRMSHELRTPLNAILGFGQLLETSPLDPPDANAVQFILKGGRHLLTMIDEVLDLARVETGKLVLHLAAVPVEGLVSECAAMVARMAEACGVTCVVEKSAASRLLVRADEQRLRQVLLNLLSNAVKYNRECGRVIVRCARAGRGRLRLSVEDTGPGIAAADLGRLFVPFERLGQEMGEVEGTGLGLAVSKELMEAMGGSLHAKSKVGRGSTFWIELPVAKTSRAPAVKTRPAPAAVPAPALVAPAGATLLYIEDNVSNIQVMKMVFERLRPRWRFLTAPDGPTGLAMVREDRPDAILLDLQLPGMNGDRVLEELRADPDAATIPVVMLSADATAHSRERLFALGASDYVSKPFNVADLLEKLEAVLRVPVDAGEGPDARPSA